MKESIADDKSVYIREDLAYKIIRSINLGVIEVDEFKTHLDVKSNQSIQIEREIITTIMKIFANKIW